MTGVYCCKSVYSEDVGRRDIIDTDAYQSIKWPAMAISSPICVHRPDSTSLIQSIFPNLQM